MKYRSRKIGFTLLELLVVIAIMGTITGVVIAKYRDYGTNARLANASENIIFAIRSAQQYGVAVRGSSGCTGGTTTFDCSFGVNFSKATPNTLTVFADNNNNGLYDSGEAVQVETWAAPVAVTVLTCDGGSCADGGGNNGNGADVMNITFKRPNPTAIIHDGSATVFTVGTISISNGTRTQIITVTKTGQISLQ